MRTTNINKVFPNGDIIEVATYASAPDVALVDYVIVYVLRQAGNLLNENLRNNVRGEIKKGRGHYMYFANSGNVYTVKF